MSRFDSMSSEQLMRMLSRVAPSHDTISLMNTFKIEATFGDSEAEDWTARFSFHAVEFDNVLDMSAEASGQTVSDAVVRCFLKATKSAHRNNL